MAHGHGCFPDVASKYYSIAFLLGTLPTS